MAVDQHVMVRPYELKVRRRPPHDGDTMGRAVAEVETPRAVVVRNSCSTSRHPAGSEDQSLSSQGIDTPSCTD